MSNRRELKKYVKTVCGELSGACIEMYIMFPDQIKREDVENLVCEAAGLQVETISKINIVFDKSRKDDLAGYAKARRLYFREAFSTLVREFNTHVNEIVKKMNELLPEGARAAFVKAEAESK